MAKASPEQWGSLAHNRRIAIGVFFRNIFFVFFVYEPIDTYMLVRQRRTGFFFLSFFLSESGDFRSSIAFVGTKTGLLVNWKEMSHEPARGLSRYEIIGAYFRRPLG